MARLARVCIPGLPHHVTQRGNRRLPVFFRPDDYAAYRDLLAASCAQHGVEIWSWCLMPNHVHLIAVPSDPDGLRAAFAMTHLRYTRRINFREGWRGHLWQGRFAAFAMDEDHLRAGARYVELNPVRAGLARRPADWHWSSARAHLDAKTDGLCTIAPLLSRYPDWQGKLAAGIEMADLERLRAHGRTGRPLGSETWVQTLERQLDRSLIPKRPGRKPKEREGECGNK